MSSQPRRSPGHRGSLARFGLLAIFALALFWFPYHLPAAPVVSLSYMAGFSNRAALIVFVLGCTIFAIVSGGRLAAMDTTDSQLSRRSLLLSLGLVLIACIARSLLSPSGAPGYEAGFFANRLQMLAAGFTPYRQFEFPYGPLLLYPPLWLARVTALSLLHSYSLWWTVQWLAGVTILWWTVRVLDFPVRSRTAVYVLIFLVQLITLRNGGENYTPFRAWLAVFVVCAAWLCWKKTAAPWRTALVGTAGFAFAIAVSMEQATSVALGVLCLLALAAWATRSAATCGALATYIAGCGILLALANHFGLLITFFAFSKGGYAYPLLPTPSICLVLFAYIVAACLAYRCLADRRFDALAIPLAVAGFAILPSALGRCDMLHITTAASAFLSGTAGIAAMPSLRRWWLPLAYFGVFALPFAVTLHQAANRVHRDFPAAASPSSAAAPPSTLTQQLHLDAQPCGQRYFAATYVPSVLKPIPACLDTGYYEGMFDVVTKEEIDQKIDELRAHSTEPLLIEDGPLEYLVKPQETDLAALRSLELSPFTPAQRIGPFDYARLIAYIRQNYTPGPIAEPGHLRLWLPNAQAQ